MFLIHKFRKREYFFQMSDVGDGSRVYHFIFIHMDYENGWQEVKRVREQNKTKRNIELPLALPVCEQQTVS